MENKTLKKPTHPKQTTEIADKSQLEIVAKRILKKNKRAFEVLGK